MKKRKNKSILYQKYLEEHAQNIEIEETSRRFDVAKENVTIKKVSSTARFMEIIMDIFYRICRIAVSLLMMALLSFALTILFNTSLRNAVFDILKSYF